MFTLILYNFILFGSTFLIYCSEKCHFSFDRKILVFLAFLLVAAPAALRYNIGYDYQSYVQIYYSNLAETHIEIGFKYLILFLNYIGLPSESFFIITSIVIYGVFYLSLPARYGYLVNYLFIATWYFESLSVIRNSMAIVFVIYSLFDLYYKNNVVKYIIFILFTSVLFHKSAALFLVIVILKSSYIQLCIFEKSKLLILLLIFCFIWRWQIIDIIINLPIIDWLGYRSYVNHEIYFKLTEFNSGLGVYGALFLLLSPLFFAKKLLKQIPNNIVFISVILCALISLILSTTYFIFSRIYLSFTIAFIFSGYLFATSTLKYKLIFLLLIIIFATALFEKNIFTSNTSKCDNIRASPYVSIFNKADDQSSSIDMCQL